MAQARAPPDPGSARRGFITTRKDLRTLGHQPDVAALATGVHLGLNPVLGPAALTHSGVQAGPDVPRRGCPAPALRPAQPPGWARVRARIRLQS